MHIYNHAEIGSGLGLSIVDKAAESLGGLCVQVRFPLSEIQ